MKIIPLALFMTLAGCASIFNGTHQDVTIKSDPEAEFVVTNQYGKVVASGATPALIELERGNGYFRTQRYEIRIKKPGFQPRKIDVEPGMSPIYFANILLGGIVGMLIVDPLTGAMYDLSPRHVETTLLPDDGAMGATQGNGRTAQYSEN